MIFVYGAASVAQVLPAGRLFPVAIPFTSVILSEAKDLLLDF
jgi:hypothetical protein